MPTCQTVWQNVADHRNKSPLVRNNTNYVVMNTAANALLAIGASPIMAHTQERYPSDQKMSRQVLVAIGGLMKVTHPMLSAPVQTETRWFRQFVRLMTRKKPPAGSGTLCVSTKDLANEALGNG